MLGYICCDSFVENKMLRLEQINSYKLAIIDARIPPHKGNSRDFDI